MLQITPKAPTIPIIFILYLIATYFITIWLQHKCILLHHQYDCIIQYKFVFILLLTWRVLLEILLPKHQASHSPSNISYTHSIKHVTSMKFHLTISLTDTNILTQICYDLESYIGMNIQSDMGHKKDNYLLFNPFFKETKMVMNEKKVLWL